MEAMTMATEEDCACPADNTTDVSQSAAQASVQAVVDGLRADVILFNGPISDATAAELHTLLESNPCKHKNVFFMLTTNGGDPHAAYVISRDLQLCYKKVIICVAGDCYSAGTLIVLCAHELVVADRGKLGPLDVQLLKKDELGVRESGLTVGMTLGELQQSAFGTFMYFLHNLKSIYGRQITLKTATDVAATMTIGMFGEIYKQIDPIRMGQDAMALKIASHYGEILGKTSNNIRPGAIDRLLRYYPAHECIIDREEAKELFVELRAPSGEEEALLKLLGPLASQAESTQTILPLNVKEGVPDNDEGDDITEPCGATVSSGPRGEHTDDSPVSGTSGK